MNETNTTVLSSSPVSWRNRPKTQKLCLLILCLAMFKLFPKIYPRKTNWRVLDCWLSVYTGHAHISDILSPFLFSSPLKIHSVNQILTQPTNFHDQTVGVIISPCNHLVVLHDDLLLSARTEFHVRDFIFNSIWVENRFSWPRSAV